jgi:hypothetical protein
MPTEPIYIHISPDLPEVLEDSEQFRNSVQRELNDQGIQAQIDWQPNPASAEKDRDVVLVILAVGAAVVAVGTAVKKVIDAINRGKPTVVVTKELIPALDRQGNAIRDRDGNPVFTSKETPAVFGAAQEPDEIRIKAGTIFEFQSASGRSVEQGKST